MATDEKLRLFQTEKVLARRASVITDPIERLRFLRGKMDGRSPMEDDSKPTRVLHGPVAGVALGVVLVLFSGYTFSRFQQSAGIRAVILPPPLPIQSAAAAASGGGVWLVESKQGVETYSNGLRVENSFAVPNIPRGQYLVFPHSNPDLRHAWKQEQPAGIVFHTTESILAPFERNQNQTLQRISSGVLNFVRTNHSYHYFLDRFGRVFRVVKESDLAFHAGHSVWADERKIYVDLNSSFLGIAFETQTQAGQGMPTATPAQIASARVLTEMLRDKYRIAAVNCVTHAQVSVNPDNQLIGYHTDWAGKFPFQEIGLSDNYADPPASLYAFGFDYDPAFVASTGARLVPGLLLADARVRSWAEKLRLPVTEYKMRLRANYKEIADRARAGESAKEIANEQ